MLSKRGSLNLSINAIVIVVLAFVMLGLGLTLTRAVIGQAQDTAIQIGDQTRDQILDLLREGDKKIAFPGKEITLESGSEELIAFGVKNNKDNALNFIIEMTLIQAEVGKEYLPSTNWAAGTTPQVIPSGQRRGEFFFSTLFSTLSVSESDVFSMKYDAAPAKGTYIYRLNIIETNAQGVRLTPDTVYASEDFFVNVV